MQKNSTSTIVRRLVLVIIFTTITHLLARTAWFFQAFGLNTPSTTSYWTQRQEQCDGPNDQIGNSISDSTGTQVYTYCIVPKKSSFFEYTSEWWPIIGTHLIGIIATTVLFAIVAWIFLRSSSNTSIACKNTVCTCAYHKQDILENGVWTYQDCTDPNCPCVQHHAEKFYVKNQMWAEV